MESEDVYETFEIPISEYNEYIESLGDSTELRLDSDRDFIIASLVLAQNPIHLKLAPVLHPNYVTYQRNSRFVQFGDVSLSDDDTVATVTMKIGLPWNEQQAVKAAKIVDEVSAEGGNPNLN